MVRSRSHAVSEKTSRSAGVTVTIARILKVNHAGECAAISIYRAQLWIAGRRRNSLVSFLTETLQHEITHSQHFLAAMPKRGATPCAAVPLWGLAGYILGLMTALMGTNAVMICTMAVEQTVHRHLEEQMAFLIGRDEELRRLIAEIQIEEIQHLDYARSRVTPSWLNGPLEVLINASTEAVIWLSTQGAVTRMVKGMRTH